MDVQETVIKVVDHVTVNKMGYRSPLDYNSINHQIQIAGYEINSGRNDGFTSFEIKKQLYKLQYLLNNILKNSQTFEGEEEYIKQLEQKMILDILRK